MYSKGNCPFCVKAKSILEENGVTVSEIKVNKDISKIDFQSYFSRQYGKSVNTVPQIILDDEYIGGHDDLVLHYDKSGIDDDAFSDFEL